MASISSPIIAELHRHEDLREARPRRGALLVGRDHTARAAPRRATGGRRRRRRARPRARSAPRSARPGAWPSRSPRRRTSAPRRRPTGPARRAAIGTFSGTRYGRGRSGAVKRSRITASCAAVNASRTPKLKRLARKSTVAAAARRRATSRTDRDQRRRRRSPAARSACAGRAGRTRAAACPCSPSEYASRPKPEIDVVAAASRISAPEMPTNTRSGVAETDPGGARRAASTMPTSGARSQSCRARCAVLAGNADRPTTAIAT